MGRHAQLTPALARVVVRQGGMQKIASSAPQLRTDVGRPAHLGDGQAGQRAVKGAPGARHKPLQAWGCGEGGRG